MTVPIWGPPGRPESGFVTCAGVERQRQLAWTELRAVLRRPTGEYLVVRPAEEADAPWDFPGVRHDPPECEEVRLRRACLERLGLSLGTLLPQGAFEYGYGTHVIRYQFFAGAVADEALPLGYGAVRWVGARQLSEYKFAPAAVWIVGRLRAGQGG